MNQFQTFKQLHQQEEPLILCNVWDAASAKVAEKLDFAALGTSSAAIASSLGYRDGEEMPFEDLLFVVQRIVSTTTLPLTVDIEAGYSRNPEEIAENIKRLMDLGAVGFNIEDSLIVDGRRQLVDAEAFATLLSELSTILLKEKLVPYINVRTDPFIVGMDEARKESIERIRLYTEAGASGAFVPCVQNEQDIEAIVEQSTVPVNVMAMPGLPSFPTLKNLGVKRISMGNWLFDRCFSHHEQNLKAVIEAQCCQPMFS